MHGSDNVSVRALTNRSDHPLVFSVTRTTKNNRALFRLLQVYLMIRFLNLVCCLRDCRDKMSSVNLSGLFLEILQGPVPVYLSTVWHFFLYKLCIRTYSTVYSNTCLFYLIFNWNKHIPDLIPFSMQFCYTVRTFNGRLFLSRLNQSEHYDWIILQILFFFKKCCCLSFFI